MAIPPEFGHIFGIKAPADNAPTSSTPTSIYNLKQQVRSLTSADIPLKLKRILIDILTHLENK